MTTLRWGRYPLRWGQAGLKWGGGVPVPPTSITSRTGRSSLSVDKLFQLKGSPMTFHREARGPECPCRTRESFRDPLWHRENLGEPICNEQGFLTPVILDFDFKGFVQPIQSTRATRLNTEYAISLVGELQADDHLGIMPVHWNGQLLDFEDWSSSGEDFIRYNGRRFTVVNVNTIPDPSDGNVWHHSEIGLRLLAGARPHA